MVTKLPSAVSNKSDDVSQRHKEYLEHEHQIELINDIYNGIDKVTKYLFQFPQEIDATFTTRKTRATLRNFVKRAEQAFTGMIFRKSIEVFGYGPRTEKLFDKIDTRNDVLTFTKQVATAVTKDGKAYILSDAPREDTPNGQPYLMLVDRLSLINWRTDDYDNYTMIVIEETISEPAGLFGTSYVTQWRVYRLEEGVVTIYIYRLDGSEYVIYETISTDFEAIPIIEVDVSDVPILYDVAKLNIKHFNRMSHKDRYLTMAALPIPIIWGADIDDQGVPNSSKPALVIGVDEAFMFTGTKQECDFEWRELSGASVSLLEDDLNAIVEDITTGILRAAETANAVQKTATEVQLLQAEASNRVSTIASAVEIGMTRALELLSTVNNETVPSTSVFIINKDFNASLMGTDGTRIILESYTMGLISMETFLQSLADAELINIESARVEMERINADTFVPTPNIKDASTQPDKRTTGATQTEAANEE